MQRAVGKALGDGEWGGNARPLATGGRAVTRPIALLSAFRMVISWRGARGGHIPCAICLLGGSSPEWLLSPAQSARHSHHRRQGEDAVRKAGSGLLGRKGCGQETRGFQPQKQRTDGTRAVCSPSCIGSPVLGWSPSIWLPKVAADSNAPSSPVPSDRPATNASVPVSPMAIFAAVIAGQRIGQHRLTIGQHVLIRLRMPADDDLAAPTCDRQPVEPAGAIGGDVGVGDAVAVAAHLVFDLDGTIPLIMTETRRWAMQHRGRDANVRRMDYGRRALAMTPADTRVNIAAPIGASPGVPRRLMVFAGAGKPAAS